MGTGESLAMLPWFARDYLAATRYLSLAERGAYSDLLFFAWEMGPLPREPERLARLLGCTAEEFGNIWPAIASKFVTQGSGLINRRLEQHRAEAQRRRAARVAAADRTNAQRRGDRYADRDANRDGQRETSTLTDPLTDTPSVTLSAAVSDTLTGTSPSPSPSPSPESGVLEDSDSRPQQRTSGRPAYMGKEFHDQVIDLYHELLPDLPRVKAWTKKRVRALNERARERCKAGLPADTIQYWRQFFEEVSASHFLCGRTTDFRADLEWLLRPENFLKVVEGRYDSGRSRNAEAAHTR